MATYGEWKRIKSEDVGKTQEERAKRAAALRGGDPAIARMNLQYRILMVLTMMRLR